MGEILKNHQECNLNNYNLKSYRIKAGETLTGIAIKTKPEGMELKDAIDIIKKYNSIDDINKIKAGYTLYFPLGNNLKLRQIGIGEKHHKIPLLKVSLDERAKLINFIDGKKSIKVGGDIDKANKNLAQIGKIMKNNSVTDVLGILGIETSFKSRKSIFQDNLSSIKKYGNVDLPYKGTLLQNITIIKWIKSILNKSDISTCKKVIDNKSYIQEPVEKIELEETQEIKKVKRVEIDLENKEKQIEKSEKTVIKKLVEYELAKKKTYDKEEVHKSSGTIMYGVQIKKSNIVNDLINKEELKNKYSEYNITLEEIDKIKLKKSPKLEKMKSKIKQKHKPKEISRFRGFLNKFKEKVLKKAGNITNSEQFKTMSNFYFYTGLSFWKTKKDDINSVVGHLTGKENSIFKKDVFGDSEKNNLMVKGLLHFGFDDLFIQDIGLDYDRTISYPTEMSNSDFGQFIGTLVGSVASFETKTNTGKEIAIKILKKISRKLNKDPNKNKQFINLLEKALEFIEN